MEGIVELIIGDKLGRLCRHQISKGTVTPQFCICPPEGCIVRGRTLLCVRVITRYYVLVAVLYSYSQSVFVGRVYIQSHSHCICISCLCLKIGCHTSPSQVFIIHASAHIVRFNSIKW